MGGRWWKGSVSVELTFLRMCEVVCVMFMSNGVAGSLCEHLSIFLLLGSVLC